MINQNKNCGKLYVGIGIIAICQFYLWQMTPPVNPFKFVLWFVILVLCYKQLLVVPPNKREQLICGGFSALLGGVAVVGQKIVFNNDIFGSYTNNYIQSITIGDGIKWILYTLQGFLLAYNIYLLTKKYSFAISLNILTKRKSIIVWLVFTIFIMLCWLPYMLVFYPGVIVGDSVASMNQAMGITGYSNHYPVLYTLFIKVFMEFGELVGSYNIGAFIYSVIQTLLIAAVKGYCGLWLIKKGAPKWVVGLAILFFGCSSVFAVYAISMWKDPLFSAFLLLFSLLLMDIALEKGQHLKSRKQIVCLASLSFLIIFWRNNGIYLVCATFILLVSIYRKKFLYAGAAMLAVVLLSLVIQGPIYTLLGIEKDTVSESLAIPIQQIAGVVVQERELTQEQEEIIFRLLPEEDWKSCYTPTIADSLKFHANFDRIYLEENVLSFIKVWAQLLVPNFGIYVESYLMETLGFWQIGIKNGNSYVYYYVYEDNAFSLHRVDWIERIFNVSAEEKLSGLVDFISTGAVVWLVLFCAVLLWMQKKYKLLLGMTPAVLLWLTVMVATPIAFSMRYILLLAYGIPIFVVLPFMKERIE